MKTNIMKATLNALSKNLHEIASVVPPSQRRWSQFASIDMPLAIIDLSSRGTK